MKRFNTLTRQDRDQMGRCYDAHLARLWDVNRETVRVWRVRLGIPPYATFRPAEEGLDPVEVDLERLRLTAARLRENRPCSFCGGRKVAFSVSDTGTTALCPSCSTEELDI